MPPAVQEACWEVFALTLDRVQVDLLSENYPTWTKPVENEEWRVPHHDLGGGGHEWRPFFSFTFPQFWLQARPIPWRCPSLTPPSPLLGEAPASQAVRATMTVQDFAKAW